MKMNQSQICVMVFVTLALLVSSTVADDVVVLTEDNFDKEVGQDRGALVEFYAPWCGYCQKFAPEYEKLGSSFKKAKSVLIGKVDCDEHKSLCSKYGVTRYPTFQWFPKGSLEPKKYEGRITVELLTNFVDKERGTNVNIGPSPGPSPISIPIPSDAGQPCRLVLFVVFCLVIVVFVWS